MARPVQRFLSCGEIARLASELLEPYDLMVTLLAFTGLQFCDVAGLRRGGLKPLTPHNLRDTGASLAVASGANEEAAQRMLGHGSAAMTLDVYSGLFDTDLDAVAARMDVTASPTLQDWATRGTTPRRRSAAEALCDRDATD